MTRIFLHNNLAIVYAAFYVTFCLAIAHIPASSLYNEYKANLACYLP